MDYFAHANANSHLGVVRSNDYLTATGNAPLLFDRRARPQLRKGGEVAILFSYSEHHRKRLRSEGYDA